MYYLYELINLMGTVEWVGVTTRPKVRLYEHVSWKPNLCAGKGKFYGRQDISMHVVATLPTKAEALQAEYDLQIYYGIPPDRKRTQGSKHGQSKLTEEQVREIKSLLAQKLSCAEIGRRFGISRSGIGNIKNGQAWTHVK